VGVRPTQRISPNAIAALRDALSVIFWRKKDLLDYLRASVENPRLLDGIDWLHPDVYKRDSVRRFVNRLASRQERHGDLLLRLMGDVATMDDFPQLAWLEDADAKITVARAAVERLRKYMEPYEARLAAEVKARDEIAKAAAAADLRRATSSALARLRDDFFELLATEDPRRRGFAFEPWLHELFDVFDLDPKASFRVVGEQIDGGFTLDHTHFLLEARWRKDLAAREDLDSFRAKVQDKAENTLGVFVSIAGFEPSAVSKHSYRGSPLQLVDGGDLLAVMDERIDLKDLLRRKHRHAAMTGEIYIRADAILLGRV
jgi:hypothetical protein